MFLSRYHLLTEEIDHVLSFILDRYLFMIDDLLLNWWKYGCIRPVTYCDFQCSTTGYKVGRFVKKRIVVNFFISIGRNIFLFC